MTPLELIDLGEGLVASDDRSLGSTRFLAAAFVMRMAIESAVDAYWVEREPGLADCPMRAQMICLPFYVEPEVASSVRSAWHRLSAACHRSMDGLPPSAADLRSWIGPVRVWIRAEL